MYEKLIIKISMVFITILFCTQTLNVQASDVSIQIPSININSMIVNVPLSLELGTWDVTQLVNTVGHLEYTPWFGGGSNTVLGAHSVALNGSKDVFYELDKVNIGDEITINDNGTSYTYQVTEIRVVNYQDVSILTPRDGETLTLFTCQIESNDGSDFYSKRHVVFAIRIT